MLKHCANLVSRGGSAIQGVFNFVSTTGISWRGEYLDGDVRLLFEKDSPDSVSGVGGVVLCLYGEGLLDALLIKFTLNAHSTEGVMLPVLQNVDGDGSYPKWCNWVSLAFVKHNPRYQLVASGRSIYPTFPVVQGATFTDLGTFPKWVSASAKDASATLAPSVLGRYSLYFNDLFPGMTEPKAGDTMPFKFEIMSIYEQIGGG